MILKFFFWILLLLILHTYVIYPLILVTLGKLIKNRKNSAPESYLPHVSVLMAIHNEERVIAAKIRKIFESDYPADRLEVLVGSDSSDDRTDELLKESGEIYPLLRIFRFPCRIGKPAVINNLSQEAGGEILVITDANVMPGTDTISKLIRNFADNSVGLVDSRLVNTGLKTEGISFPEVAYIGFESKLKNIEGRLWGTMMGPFGGFYAVRKRSYQPNAGNTLADDFRICMNVIKKGGKGISDQEAVVFEDVTDNLGDEFLRKVRISSGNFQNLSHFAYLFLKPFSIFSFCFISHKALRWISPMLWLIMIFSNILLLESSLLYRLFFLLQVIFILLPPLDLFLKYIRINVAPLRFFTHLYFMNIAMLAGFVKYLRGIRSGVWTPTKRYQ